MRENDVNTESVEATGSNDKSGNVTGRDGNGIPTAGVSLTVGNYLSNAGAVKATESGYEDGTETYRDENGFYMAPGEIAKLIADRGLLVMEMMLMKQQYEGIYEEKRIALRGTIIACNYGTRDVKMGCEEDYGIYSNNDRAVLTKKDRRPANIYSFGSCLCPEEEYEGNLLMNPEEDSSGWRARKARYNKSAHICNPLIAPEDEWIQKNETIEVMVDEETGEYALALDESAVLACQYGGYIYVKEVPDEAEEDDVNQLITKEQMNDFGFEITEDGLRELNELLEEYGITDSVSIAMFMATCAHESTYGTELLENGPEDDFNGYTMETRGAGYIQITGDDHKTFLNHINETKTDVNEKVLRIPLNTAEFIAENFAWKSAVWEWGMSKKGDGVVLNDYVTKHKGESDDHNLERVFLVTQYFINGYLKKEEYPSFDPDMRKIRAGLVPFDVILTGEYIDVRGKECIGRVQVEGRVYRLPINYDDRQSCFNKAIGIFNK